LIPALLISTSMSPSRFAAQSRTESRSATSSSTTDTDPPIASARMRPQLHVAHREHHVGARVRKAARGLESDPVGRPGDDDAATVQAGQPGGRPRWIS
jgi:hypothetical protein